MTDLDPHLEALRALLHDAPSEVGWRALCAALERWPAGHEALALDYALPHLSAWPDALRRPPGHWALARALGQPTRWWPLARAWHVVVTDHHQHRIKVIKALRDHHRLLLNPAKKITDRAPYLAALYESHDRALALWTDLTQAGAEATLERDRPALCDQLPLLFTADGAVTPEALPGQRDVLLARLFGERRALQLSLDGVELAHSALYDVDMSDIDLTGRDLRQILWSNVNLQRARLSGARLSGAVGNALDLRDADLRGADLTNLVLNGGDIDGADLRGADLSYANLGCAGLERALLDGAITDGASSWPPDPTPT